jgi:hypothetical protein
MSEVKLNRAISVSQLYSTKHNVVEFEGAWYDAIGKPELKGAWLIWGDSANGKTRFALQLCKYLAQFTRVAYDSLEEGASLSMKRAFKEVGMEDVGRRVMLLDNEPMDELRIRLRKRRSPNVIIIDSVQYSGMNYKDYRNLRAEFDNKLFILISHAEGKQPAGRTAKSIRYDAFVKIRVEGYRAFCAGRYGGGVPYTIWDEGAANYYNEDL